jgi:hypothetical protein
MRRYLLEFPKTTLAAVTWFLYWQETEFGLKPTIRISHVVIRQGPDEATVASKMLYATHYFWTGLELRALLQDPSRGSGFWFVNGEPEPVGRPHRVHRHGDWRQSPSRSGGGSTGGLAGDEASARGRAGCAMTGRASFSQVSTHHTRSPTRNKILKFGRTAMAAKSFDGSRSCASRHHGLHAAAAHFWRALRAIGLRLQNPERRSPTARFRH